MFTRNPSIIVRLTVTVVVLAGFTLVRLLLNPVIGEGVPFILYYLAVVLCAWYGKFWQGVIATVLSTIIALYLFIPPADSFAVKDLSGWVQLIVYLISGVLISMLAESLHRARSRAEEAEASAQKRKEEFQVTLASIGDAVIATDIEARVTFMNSIAESLTGWKWTDAQGKPLEEVFRILNEKSRQPVENPARKALEQGTIIGLANHTILLNRNEQECSIDDSAAPIRDSNGELVGVVLVFRDITERKRAEGRLRESEERFRLATSAGRVGVWDWDIINRRVSWSESLYAIHGLKHEEFDGTAEASSSLIHPDDYPRVAEAIQRALEHDATYEMEFRLVRPGGAIIWVHTHGQLVRDAAGRPLRMLGITVDITERRELLAREQAARAEAQEANRMKDEFLATVSHELRSPLNGILGWVKLLQAKRLGEEDATRALDTIERNVRAQAKLIEDLLEVSRIITGKVRLDMQKVDLNRIIEVAADSIRPLARAKDIELQTTLDPSIGFISGDEQRLLQIVGNLLSNAVKFTPRQGQIDLRLCRAGSQAEIAVRDTGQGISPDFLPQVFDRFKQASTGSARSNGGLGLGLAIVRHLVELHSGTVEAESEGIGRGSTFRVRLPLAAASEEIETIRKPGAETPFECKPMLDGVQILVLDDSKDARELIGVILCQCAATVVVADTPAKAREILATRPVDLILSDIEMPEEDGYAFIRSVRKMETDRKIPAVALTAYVRSEDRSRALIAGFQYHLPKPVEPAELIAVVCNLTGRPYLMKADTTSVTPDR